MSHLSLVDSDADTSSVDSDTDTSSVDSDDRDIVFPDEAKYDLHVNPAEHRPSSHIELNHSDNNITDLRQIYDIDLSDEVTQHSLIQLPQPAQSSTTHIQPTQPPNTPHLQPTQPPNTPHLQPTQPSNTPHLQPTQPPNTHIQQPTQIQTNQSPVINPQTPQLRFAPNLTGSRVVRFNSTEPTPQRGYWGQIQNTNNTSYDRSFDGITNRSPNYWESFPNISPRWGPTNRINDLSNIKKLTQIKDSEPQVISRVVMISCVVCYVNQINTIIQPCMHSCVCSLCAKQIIDRSKQCPLCQRDITNVNKIYLSSSEPTESDISNWSEENKKSKQSIKRRRSTDDGVVSSSSSSAVGSSSSAVGSSSDAVSSSSGVVNSSSSAIIPGSNLDTIEEQKRQKTEQE